jgi:hypothetical protein
MMPAPGEYRIKLLAELEKEFDEVIGYPPDLIPSGETVVIYPDDPYIEHGGGYCDWIVRLSVVVFYGRAVEDEALRRAEGTVEKVEAAVREAGGTYREMAYRPINIGGVDYLAAVHPVTFNEEE